MVRLVKNGLSKVSSNARTFLLPGGILHFAFMGVCRVTRWWRRVRFQAEDGDQADDDVFLEAEDFEENIQALEIQAEHSQAQAGAAQEAEDRDFEYPSTTHRCSSCCSRVLLWHDKWVCRWCLDDDLVVAGDAEGAESELAMERCQIIDR